MPAVTVENILVLPRVQEPIGNVAERKVTSVTTAPSGFEGEGFPVRRAFAGVDLERLDPFVHMDQMGEVDYGPGEPKGTPWHPHRGFETVTYIIDGTFRHQDSNGGGGLITDGDTQWMTAGGGILHIEAPPEELVVSGGLFHGIQLWVNLPARLKMTQPRYQDIRAGQVALLSSADGGALLRVIAGSFSGEYAGPGITHTPITLLHATVSPGAQVRLPWRADFNALAYVLAGSGTVGAEKRPVRMGQLAAFGAGDAITFAASGPAGPGHPAAGRRADPGAGGGLRAVRHEHPRRAGAGLRGLPGRAAGVDPRAAAPGPRRYLGRTVRGASGPEKFQGQRGAGGHRAAGFQVQRGRDRPRVEYGIAPLVEGDELGQKLGADAVPGAVDGIHPQGVGHGHIQSSSVIGMPSGSGRNGRWFVAEQRPWACRPISGANTVSALRTNRTVPSGWLQAPRPVTRPAQRSRSARTCLRCPCRPVRPGRRPSSAAR